MRKSIVQKVSRNCGASDHIGEREVVQHLTPKFCRKVDVLVLLLRVRNPFFILHLWALAGVVFGTHCSLESREDCKKEEIGSFW
jgi:hypothetical protein